MGRSSSRSPLHIRADEYFVRQTANRKWAEKVTRSFLPRVVPVRSWHTFRTWRSSLVMSVIG